MLFNFIKDCAFGPPDYEDGLDLFSCENKHFSPMEQEFVMKYLQGIFESTNDVFCSPYF